MTPYHDYVSAIATLVRQGKSLPLGGFAIPSRPTPATDAPVALIFAPHPDDAESGAGGIVVAADARGRRFTLRVSHCARR